MKFGFDLYGLKTNAAVNLIGMPKKKVYKNPDVLIKIEPVKRPKSGLDGTHYLPFSVYNKDFYFLDIPGVAKYYIDSNNTVSIAPHTKKKLDTAIYFFQDTVLAVLLLRNNIFPIYGSAVKLKNGGANLFCTPRGEGKSTLASVLCLFGHRLISDNFTVLVWDEKRKHFKTKAYTNYIDLWKNVFPLFKGKTFSKRLLKKGILKYRFDFEKYTYNKFVPIEKIYIINVKNEEIPLSIEDIKGMQKIEAVNTLIKSYPHFHAFPDKQTLFSFSGKIANKIPLKKITRSKIHYINPFSKFVLNEISTKTADSK